MTVPDVLDAVDEFASTDRARRYASAGPDGALFRCTGTAKALATHLNRRGIPAGLVRATVLLDDSRARPELADAQHHPQFPPLTAVHTPDGHVVDVCARQWDQAKPFPYITDVDGLLTSWRNLVPVKMDYLWPVMMLGRDPEISNRLALREMEAKAADRRETSTDVIRWLLTDDTVALSDYQRTLLATAGRWLGKAKGGP